MARILIIEDDPEVRETLSVALSQSGHECDTLSTGQGAVEMARQSLPDLLLLDVMLPGVSGFEICRQVRRDPALYTVPILIVSAMCGEQEVSHGIAQGADDYVAKPFDVSNIVQRVNTLLRNQAGTDSDELTALPGADSIKREIQKRISSKEIFGLGCAELVGLREYARRLGGEARLRAIRHLGRILERCGRSLDEGFFLGHMGGGYFVCIMPPEHVASYAKKVRSLWKSHMEKLHETDGDGRGTAGGAQVQRRAWPSILVCATLNDEKGFTTSQHMFEVLAQLRHKALRTEEGGILLDRRASQPHST